MIINNGFSSPLTIPIRCEGEKTIISIFLTPPFLLLFSFLFSKFITQEYGSRINNTNGPESGDELLYVPLGT